MKPISVLLVDDHAMLREGLRAIFSFHKDIHVVGDAENGKEALQLVRDLKPDVVVMDLMMPVMDGLSATRKIKSEFQAVKVLILTTFGSSADVALALDDGASGAIMKDASRDDLLQAIRTIANGGSFLAPEIRRVINSEPRPKRLTDKQLTILESATRGFTNADIAKQLDISIDMVTQHMTAIYQKLGAANRTEAVAIALRKQLLKI